MEFQLVNKNVTRKDVLDDYVDVYFHIEEKNSFTTVPANKVLLALRSPYLHKLFQSGKKSESFHLHFKGVTKHTISDAVRVMNGETIEIPENNADRLILFLKSLDVEFENSQQEPLAKKKKNPKLKTPIPLESEFENEVLESCSSEFEFHGQLSQLSSNIKSSNVNTKVAPLPSKSNPTVDAYQLPSSSKSIRITNRKGEPATLDNWTETSDDVNVDAIDFKIEKGSPGKHKKYVCCHCGIYIKSFATAQYHFINHHQKNDAELEIIQKAFNCRKETFDEIDKIQREIENGCDQVFAINKIEMLMSNLQEQINDLQNLEEKKLSPHLITKKKNLIKSMNKFIQKTKTFTDKLE